MSCHFLTCLVSLSPRMVRPSPSLAPSRNSGAIDCYSQPVKPIPPSPKAIRAVAISGLLCRLVFRYESLTSKTALEFGTFFISTALLSFISCFRSMSASPCCHNNRLVMVLRHASYILSLDQCQRTGTEIYKSMNNPIVKSPIISCEYLSVHPNFNTSSAAHRIQQASSI
ncbi:hypothetical protein B0T19DRAFT_415967 [Cercophora scortea]|uniref:Uncharacterized protein n=1 Tax=Cercophora scortea TaxID=314031 RepID=A0AAE0MHN3_9PEZI|nr:hypothetical protein B0T19DRAFT_415967 [Cercophora scortea]